MPKSFEERFKDLQAYQQKNGHCRVTLLDKKSNPSLVNWCFNARTSYRQIQEGTKPLINLTPERIHRMDCLGFVWRLTKDPSYTYQVGFEKLVSYKAQRGHCNVPMDYHDHDLVRWCEKQRKAYWVRMNAGPYVKDVSNRRFKLTIEKIERLENLGFKWTEPEPERVIHKSSKQSTKSKKHVEEKVQIPHTCKERVKKDESDATIIGSALKERSMNVKEVESTNDNATRTRTVNKKASQPKKENFTTRKDEEESLVQSKMHNLRWCTNDAVKPVDVGGGMIVLPKSRANRSRSNTMAHFR